MRWASTIEVEPYTVVGKRDRLTRQMRWETLDADLTYDADVYEQALRDVMGRPVEFNGRNILPPVPNMDEDDVEDAIQRLTFEDLQTFGNGLLRR